MATSGSYDYSVNAGELALASARAINIIDPGESLTSDEQADILQALNLLVKQWQANPNMVNKGLQVWHRKVTTLDTSSVGASNSYTLAPAGDVAIQVPVNIVSVLRRTSGSKDTLLTPMNKEEYDAIPDKTSTGTPSRYFYERGLSSGVLYFDKTPSDTTIDYVITYVCPLEDLDASTDDFDFPQEWYRALKWNLAAEIWPSYYDDPIKQSVAAFAVSSLEMANLVEPETTTLYFQPEA